MKRVIPAAAAAAIVAGGLVVAGPLMPPAGPVASSYKTLSEIEPRIAVNAANTPGDVDNVYKITAPGSYYLPGNLAVPGTKVGIRITCSDVTLDLCGFTISGGGLGVAAVPAVLPGSQSNVRVRHGTVRGTASTGVMMYLTGGGVIEDMAAYGCDTGFYGAARCTFTNCRAEGNAAGFDSGEKCSFRSCIAAGNATWGFNVIGDGPTVVDCLADGNGTWGFGLDNDSCITGSTAHGNGGVGIFVNQGSVVADCVARGNSGTGVHVAQGSVVRHTTACEGAAVGFQLMEGASIESCSARNNGLDGILADANARIVGNLCTQNGQASTTGAGIRVTNFGNRIEDNHTAGNDKGIAVTGINNILIRNAAGGNAGGNFDVVAGNELATVVTNPGSNGFATANPWSNLVY